MDEQSLSHKQRALSLDRLRGTLINTYEKVNTNWVGWLPGTRCTQLFHSCRFFFSFIVTFAATLLLAFISDMI